MHGCFLFPARRDVQARVRVYIYGCARVCVCGNNTPPRLGRAALRPIPAWGLEGCPGRAS
eukprot:scaffold8103_cov403-Prasinococcus_capsulatus_cf.AAC.12